MQITFDSLYEIKYFVLHADTTAFAGKNFFGGLGMIITNKMPEENIGNAVVTIDSAVYRSDRNDIVIVTPYAEELSWLAGQLCEFGRKDENCPFFTEIMEIACKGFFLLHRGDEYCAKELLLFVIEFMDKAYKDEAERAGYKYSEDD